ncbi:MAG: hypothetical protein ACT6R6_18635 [Flavobacterium sp.]
MAMMVPSLEPAPYSALSATSVVTQLELHIGERHVVMMMTMMMMMMI